MVRLTIVLFGCLITHVSFAQTATLNINRKQVTPLAAGFSGFNVVSSNTPADFADPKFRSVVKPLAPGTLRWPGGTVDDMFNWKTGLIEVPLTSSGSAAWTMIDIMRAHFAEYTNANFYKQIDAAQNTTAPILFAKSGHPLGDASSGFAGFSSAVGAKKLMIVVNTISDTVASAKELAYYIAVRRLPVAGFELANEPFYVTLPSTSIGPTIGADKHGVMPPVPGVFLDGVDYATKMKPYYDAIKSGYTSAGLSASQAVVMIAGGYATDTGKTSVNWAADLATYANKNGAYWDAVVMHFYPAKAQGDNPAFSDEMTAANNALSTGTDPYLQQFKSDVWSRGKKLYVSEYDVTFADQVMNGSVYGGIFSAEYIMRMSKDPTTQNVLLHELTNQINGVGAPPNALGGNNWTADLKSAGASHQKMRTMGRVSRLYYNAQALAVAVANRAVNVSDQVYATSLTGPLGTVKTNSSVIPALHAQAYHGSDDTLQILITNKGFDARSLTINLDGQAVSKSFKSEMMTPTAGDPSERNTATAQPIQIQAGSAKGTIEIPGYSVVHLWQ